MLSKFKYYIEIIKPRIIFGNMVLMMGSFLLASQIHFDFNLFLYTLSGMSLVIASSCILNNIIDYDIDNRMQRTKNRVLVKKLLNQNEVLIFSFIIGTIGFFILGYLVNILSMLLAFFGFLIYVIFYTYILKRISIYSTLIGSFSGSIPSVIGYTAVVNTIDLFSFLLFINFIFWQMSHFYSIAIFRINDYKNARIPVFPVIKGIFLTKKHIIVYIILYIFINLLFSFFGYLSYMFLFLSSFINVIWLYLACYNFYNIDEKKYSIKLFKFSIIVVFVCNFLMAIDFLF
ncbi:heme o synthase [Buchnera aphidicola]|uniref:heme o synthase n=1 Tax=Buchnera aphidicola TaxID=9 RepID=UPI003BEEDBB4